MLYLVRHGQTDLNRDKRFRGRADVPLNEDGKLEAAGAARLLAAAGISRIYTSPIRRSVETATAIAVRTGARMETHESFTDIDYGEWQGLTVEEVRERFGDACVEAWRTDPGAFSFPGGEGIRAVRERLEPALAGLAQEAGEGGIAVVTHLAVLKLCFVVLLDLDDAWFWRVGLDNGSVGAFSHTRERGFVLERWNQPPFQP